MKIYPTSFMKEIVGLITEDIKILGALQSQVPSHVGQDGSFPLQSKGNCDPRCQRCRVEKLHNDLVNIAANLDMGA